ncbi:MAG TPA: cyclic beta 1-2 glucan synthetase, partial [Planctomycetota bacterium]|nr:cyclic beta 1-2 glucan synthetase [Planctomycetota bacterium]
YSRTLPRLAAPPSTGIPRVYDLVLELVSHSHGRLDLEGLRAFVAAYQSVQALRLGELWAIPIMLRLALIENLRRVAARVALDRRHRDLAANWGESMADIVAQDPKSLILAVADMARSNPPVSSSFVAELMQRLQSQSASLALPVSWLEQRLAEAGLTIEQLVQSENQQQAADQMSVSNSIGSLRLLLSTDWRGFVEALSAIEAVLATDPAGVYAQMDFATRDDYRHVVERAARRSGRSESEIAEAAVGLAREAAGAGTESPEAHVGYYLVGPGRATLERACGLRATLRFLPLPVYLLALAALTAGLTVGPVLRLLHLELTPALVVVLGALLALATSQLAQIVVNWLAALFTS